MPESGPVGLQCAAVPANHRSRQRASRSVSRGVVPGLEENGLHHALSRSPRYAHPFVPASHPFEHQNKEIGRDDTAQVIERFQGGWNIHDGPSNVPHQPHNRRSSLPHSLHAKDHTAKNVRADSTTQPRDRLHGVARVRQNSARGWIGRWPEGPVRSRTRRMNENGPARSKSDRPQLPSRRIQCIVRNTDKDDVTSVHEVGPVACPGTSDPLGQTQRCTPGPAYHSLDPVAAFPKGNSQRGTYRTGADQSYPHTLFSRLPHVQSISAVSQSKATVC